MHEIYESGAVVSDSFEGVSKALRLYENIRKRSTDCRMVSKNTGIVLERCNIIKNYMFNDRHILSNNRYDRFYPDYAMAQSWLRLSSKNGKYFKHDILLLHHEWYEIELVISGKYTCTQAHEIASRKYNYSNAVKVYERSFN